MKTKLLLVIVSLFLIAALLPAYVNQDTVVIDIIQRESVLLLAGTFVKAQRFDDGICLIKWYGYNNNGLQWRYREALIPCSRLDIGL